MNKKQLIVDLRLQFIITVFLILFSSHAVYAQKAADVENREPVLVADQYYAWDCPEGNLGISISAKFNSRDQMEATLSLLKEIGTYQSKKWKLSDVLI